MISRWIIAALILLTSQQLNGVRLGDKKETIPESSSTFVESEINGHEGNIHSRQRRVGREPPENPVNLKDTGNTTAVMNGSTTTEATASEARDMEETSVKPKDDDDDDGTTVKSINNSTVSTSAKSTQVPGTSGNQTKTEEGTNKTVQVTNKNSEVMNKTEKVSHNTTALPATIVKSTTVMTSEQTEVSTTTTIPRTNATINCPGVNTTYGIAATDLERCPPNTFPSTSAQSIVDSSPSMKQRLEEKYNTSGTENNSSEVEVDIHTLSPSLSTTTETPQEMMESREEVVEKMQQMKSQAKLEKSGLPGGAVALLVAISFAMMAVIAYLGLIVRKRYQRNRFGNRELLVNDFDTNDINNFEL